MDKVCFKLKFGPPTRWLKSILELEPLGDSEHAKNGMIHCMFMIQSYGIVVAARFQVNTNANMAKSGPSRPFNYSKHKSCPCKYFSISLHLICQTMSIATLCLVYNL